VAIREADVSAVCVGQLLKQDLRIPHYQRPYSWDVATALQLLDDIADARTDQPSSGVPYVLGTVILHAVGDGFDVVDGQQRLLSLQMILRCAEGQDDHAVFGTAARADSPVTTVWKALEGRLKAQSSGKRRELTGFIRERCQLVRVVTHEIDEAFRVFDSQNYRGKSLAPHDLLKAHHLREMRDETDAMKTAVVENWESVSDEDLDRLFSTYLYRIACWSEGERAQGFTAHDIGMFKGISPRNARSPSARYHLAAQAALPMLNLWGASSSAGDDRDAGRTRFQLDAPLLAGRPFFEMVAFMLEELQRLKREGFPDGWEPFASYDRATLQERPARSRYRYVSELYMAALLYYTNRFSEDDISAVRERLFAWAYTLRVAQLRVQLASVDKLGRGDGGGLSAFVLLRNASSGRVVHQLPASSASRGEEHEAQLAQLLKELGA
jgi:hypothetical protein